MKRQFAKFIFCVFIIFPSISLTQNWQRNNQIENIFKDAGVEGTFVLYDIDRDRVTGHNERRAHVRYIPASTFKIANSLIGLKMGAVADVDEILPYGGKPQFMEAWEKDMSLRDAIKISNVPIYQELARRIGPEAMTENLAAIKYGNKNIGRTVDQFWLEGPLTISALEQTEFLAKLVKNELPFTPEIQNTVKDILMLEQTTEVTLYGKTGWTTAPDPDIGWWVGWVTRGDKTYTFALNIDTHDMNDVNKRVEIGRACLKALGLL